jgi:hypothetical protein
MTYFATRTNFEATNHPTTWVIGQARGLANEFGWPGIMGKTGEKKRRILRKGYMRLVWRTRQEGKRFQGAIDEMYGDRTTTKRYRNPNRYPHAK